jgi:DNA-directed RNA polymerase subunit F
MRQFSYPEWKAAQLATHTLKLTPSEYDELKALLKSSRLTQERTALSDILDKLS